MKQKLLSDTLTDELQPLVSMKNELKDDDRGVPMESSGRILI